ncbi:MAG TPA: FAD-dependent oxidoreductase [Burkholderiaceae bacterium]
MPLPPGKPTAGMTAMGGVGSAFAAVAQPDPASDAALEAPFSVLQNRKHQAFPRLTQAEIARMMRFGTVRQFGRDDYLCRIGDRAVGMVVVLRGRIQVVLRDGMGRETRPPEQGPGNFACEVGQLSGRAAMADILALEPVEVLHINPENLRALITAEAELGERIMRALILRRVNLIEQGSGPVLLGCGKRPGLLALQSFLRRNGYPHTVIDAQNDPEAVEVIQRLSPSAEDFPLVLCQDGSILRAPDVGRLASHLGLIPEFDPEHVYDVVVVGAGPAGLAATVYAASEGLSVALFDAHAPGGQAGASARIENYLGFPTGITGQALAGRAFAQAQKFGAHVAIPTEVAALRCGESPMRLELAGGTRIATRSVVIASGAVYRHPEIENLQRHEGSGVFYWASPIEAKLCKGREAIVIGGGNSAGQATVFLASHAAHVHLMVRGPGLEASMSRYLIDRIKALPNVTLHTHSTVTALHGEQGGMSGVTVLCRATGEPVNNDFDVRQVFSFVGADPNSAWLRTCPVQLDGKGFVVTGADVREPDRAMHYSLETSVPGVFAIGDVRANSTKRVAAAVGEGAAVVAQVHTYLAQLAQSARVAG